MQIRYCWRCRADVPMMDEVEFSAWSLVYESCLSSAKSDRREADRDFLPARNAAHFAEARRYYSQATGAPETDADEIRRHRLQSLGPQCPHCGKPKRTSRASICAECGTR